MADFCRECVQDAGGPGAPGDLNDMQHDGPGNIYALCEGCGWHYFDERGYRQSLFEGRADALKGGHE